VALGFGLWALGFGRVHAGATEAFTLSADYGGADHVSRRREHAVGTSQLTELAASGPLRRAQCLPAPESEALDVNASVAPVLTPARRHREPVCRSAKPTQFTLLSHPPSAAGRPPTSCPRTRVYGFAPDIPARADVNASVAPAGPSTSRRNGHATARVTSPRAGMSLRKTDLFTWCRTTR